MTQDQLIALAEMCGAQQCGETGEFLGFPSPEALEAFATALAAAKAEPAEDAARLDWVVRQAEDFSCSIIVDAPGDGDYLVNGMNTSGQAKTAREAIDIAMEAERKEARA